jgi:hypothetical protein
MSPALIECGHVLSKFFACGVRRLKRFAFVLKATRFLHDLLAMLSVHSLILPTHNHTAIP